MKTAKIQLVLTLTLLAAFFTVGRAQEYYKGASGGGISSSGVLANACATFPLGTLICEPSANIIEHRNGTNAQLLNVDNTFTDATHYERLEIGVNSAFLGANFFGVVANQGSGGGTNRNLGVGTNGAGNLVLFTGGSTSQGWTISGSTGDLSDNSTTHNILAGASVKSKGPTAGIGYATGAGGAVTQITSRATGVTLSTVTGDITLVSAAGSATPASFVVTNTAVAVTDNVVINQKSGTDLYEVFVTNVAAGSFKVTCFTTGGTTTEQPVFHFSVVKGVIS